MELEISLSFQRNSQYGLKMNADIKAVNIRTLFAAHAEHSTIATE